MLTKEPTMLYLAFAWWFFSAIAIWSLWCAKSKAEYEEWERWIF